VSGANDKNEKCPLASVVVVACCKGDTIVTTAPETGAELSDVTTPLTLPVVPASVHVAWQTNAISVSAATNAWHVLILCMVTPYRIEDDEVAFVVVDHSS
jgi:hypothetical protein